MKNKWYIYAGINLCFPYTKKFRWISKADNLTKDIIGKLQYKSEIIWIKNDLHEKNSCILSSVGSLSNSSKSNWSGWVSTFLQSILLSVVPSYL